MVAEAWNEKGWNTQEGLVIAIIALDQDTFEIIHGPEIESHGFLYKDDRGDILENAKVAQKEFLDKIPNLIEGVQGIELLEGTHDANAKLWNFSYEEDFAINQFFISQDKQFRNYKGWNEFIGFEYGSVEKEKLKFPGKYFLSPFG